MDLQDQQFREHYKLR